LVLSPSTLLSHNLWWLQVELADAGEGQRRSRRPGRGMKARRDRESSQPVDRSRSRSPRRHGGDGDKKPAGTPLQHHHPTASQLCQATPGVKAARVCLTPSQDVPHISPRASVNPRRVRESPRGVVQLLAHPSGHIGNTFAVSLHARTSVRSERRLEHGLTL
jgi:hypothetical protein